MVQFGGMGNPVRFEQWYSHNADTFNNISTGACNATLAAYHADRGNFGSPTCARHLDCMLGETSETLKAQMAAAAIFLGVLPAMLSMMGPSLPQVTLLSARRPLLSLLLVIGTAGFYLDRLFTIESPVDILRATKDVRFVPRIRSRRWGIVVGVFEYLLAAVAVLNIINVTLRIGDRTIMSFQCALWYLPLVWLFSTTIVYLMVAIPFQFSRLARYLRSGKHHKSAEPFQDDGEQWDPLQQRPWDETRPVFDDQGVSVGKSIISRAHDPHGKPRRQMSDSFVLREISTGLSQPPLKDVEEIPDFEAWMAVLFNTSTFLASFLLIMGTCWFSSVLFLSPRDAILIIMRFFASAIACRVVLTLELKALKARQDTGA